MEEKEKTKSVWNDITKVWARIAGVIAAIGLLATAIVKIFNTSPEITYLVSVAIGLVLLIISFYVDRQAKYTHEEIVNHDKKIRDDFMEILNNQKTMSDKYRQETGEKIQTLIDSLETLVKTSQETRKDTVRIQLLMVIESQPENVDTIMKLAETYFVELKGDWYMTSEFSKWAKAHDIAVPANIYNAIDEVHNK